MRTGLPSGSAGERRSVKSKKKIMITLLLDCDLSGCGLKKKVVVVTDSAREAVHHGGKEDWKNC